MQPRSAAPCFKVTKDAPAVRKSAWTVGDHRGGADVDRNFSRMLYRAMTTRVSSTSGSKACISMHGISGIADHPIARARSITRIAQGQAFDSCGALLSQMQ